MSAPAQRKRGRPPKVFMSSGTAKLYADLKITRQQASDWIAIASLPKDVFEAALKDHSRKVTTRGLVNFARNRPLDHRRGDLLTEALRAAQKLSAADRHFLCVAILSADEAAQVIADVNGRVERT